jgi:hypothetical protein
MQYCGKRTQEVAQTVIRAFEQPECLPKALAPILIKRKDDVPCRRWSWHNQLLTALCGTADARGIRQWRTVGRSIKKGCHAVWILAPMAKTITEEADNGERRPRRILYGFKSIPVFRVEDTDGEPLPVSDDKYDSWVQELPLTEVARAWNVNVGTYTHHGSRDPLGYYQYGNAGQKAIMLGVENLSTWVHELVHAADHKLDDQKRERWHKEIVAELGSAVLLECLGMTHDADLGGAYEYIAHYATTAKKPVVKACIEVLDRVCNCVSLVLDTADEMKESAIPA